MQQLPLQVKERKLNELLLPGTHNSHAYKLNFAKPLGKLKKFALVLRLFPFFKKILANWTQIQKMDLSSQLKAGIRFLDFRVSYHNQEKRYYLTHTFTCMPLEEGLQEVKGFMDASRRGAAHIGKNGLGAPRDVRSSA